MTSPFAPPRELLNALRTSLSPRRVEIPVIPQPSGQPQLAHRNNNPGNLRFAGQRGAQPGDKGFAQFNSPEEGYEALLQQVRKDQARGLPLGAFIAKYAPATENDTGLYIRQAAAKLNVDPGELIDKLPAEALAEFMARKESGATVQSVAVNPLSEF